MFRSLIHPKTLAFVGASVAAAVVAFGCGIRDGELPLPRAWNEEDHAYGRCVGQCTPDYGARPITMEECARVEEGLEFFPAPVWDFETPGNDSRNMLMTDPGTGTQVVVAALAYAYQDGTTEFLATHGDLSYHVNADPDGEVSRCTAEFHAREPIETNCQASYEPTTAPVDRCGSAHAWHVRGGPFREWGGGVGRRLDNVARNAAMAMGSNCTIPPVPNPDPPEPAFCPEFEQRIADAPGSVLTRQDGGPFMQPMNAEAYYTMMVDLREWDGISFWARRGPDSQPGFRVSISDRNLDDDVSFQETVGGLAPRCRRSKECDCKNHRPCTPGPNGGLYCWDPTLDAHPNAQWHPWNHEPALCGFTQCDDPYAAYPNQPDPPFYTPNRTDNTRGTASCNTFTFRNDITRENCYDPVRGPTPAEGFEKCGDPWIAPIRLNENWTFYRVPFSDLRQEGYGKEFPAIDLSAITAVRFTWTVGWIDFWLDDVRFYRRK